MGWKSLIEAGWKPPYLAFIRISETFSGTGFLVGPRHVLTVLHVVGDHLDAEAAERRSHTIGEPLLEPPPDTAFDVSFASDPGKPHVGRCRDFDRQNDIALIELDTTIHGVARPRFAEGPTRERQQVVALGFLDGGIGKPPRFYQQTGEAALAAALREGARDHHYQVRYGAQGGFSGGPVFIADDGACPRLIGMSRLGGDGAGQGQIVAVDLIADWLRERLHDVPTRPETPGGWSEALTRGFEPFHRVAPGPDFLFAAIESADRAARRQTFVALAPLSRATGRGATTTTMPFDDERPAHFGSQDAVARMLERLGGIHGLRFRSPSSDEIARLGALARGAPPDALLGEPVTLRHFVADDGGPRLPPDGVLEWCATGSGLAIREHRGGVLGGTRDTVRPQTRHIARLAFDVEIGA